MSIHHDSDYPIRSIKVSVYTLIVSLFLMVLCHSEAGAEDEYRTVFEAGYFYCTGGQGWNYESIDQGQRVYGERIDLDSLRAILVGFRGVKDLDRNVKFAIGLELLYFPEARLEYNDYRNNVSGSWSGTIYQPDVFGKIRYYLHRSPVDSFFCGVSFAYATTIVTGDMKEHGRRIPWWGDYSTFLVPELGLAFSQADTWTMEMTLQYRHEFDGFTLSGPVLMISLLL